MKSRIYRLAALMLVAAALALAGCASGPAPGATAQPSHGDMPAPDFELTSLDGQTVTLSGLRGQPVLINFWASWCGPCRSEMPYIQELYEDAAWTDRGLVILAVNIGEPADTAREFMAENGLTFTVLLDSDEAVAHRYNVRAIPTTFLVGADGMLRGMDVGAFTSKAAIERSLSDAFGGS